MASSIIVVIPSPTVQWEAGNAPPSPTAFAGAFEGLSLYTQLNTWLAEPPKTDLKIEDVHLLYFDPSAALASEQLVSDILCLSPSLLLLCWHEDHHRLLSHAVEDLRLLGDPAPKFAFGAMAQRPKQGPAFLQSQPGLTGLMTGRLNAPIGDLINALLMKSGPSSLPANILMRDDDNLVWGALQAKTDAPSTAPIPQSMETLSFTSKAWGALELGRVDPETGIFSAFPDEHIRDNLDKLLGDNGPGDILVLPSSVEFEPFFLRWFLGELKRREVSARFHLPLQNMPEDPLTPHLLEAGVRWLSIPLASLPTAKAFIHLKTRVYHLRNAGLLTSIHIDLPLPGATPHQVELLLDGLLENGVGSLKLSQRIGFFDAAPSPSLDVYHQTPPHFHLQSEAFPYQKRHDLLANGRTLSALLPTFSATLRSLRRLLGLSLLATVDALTPWLPDLEKSVPLKNRVTILHGAIAKLLPLHRRGDAIGPLEDLLEFEASLADGPPPPAFRSINHDDIEEIVPALSPRAQKSTYAHDVIALAKGRDADDCPASRTEVLIITQAQGNKWPFALTRLDRLFIEMVDGILPINVLVNELMNTQQNQAMDINVLINRYGELMTMGALIAVGTQNTPPEPDPMDNVLHFPKRPR